MQEKETLNVLIPSHSPREGPASVDTIPKYKRERGSSRGFRATQEREREKLANRIVRRERARGARVLNEIK